jgi:hypothetical protein
MELAAALLKLYPEQYHVEKILDILASKAVYDELVRGEDPHRIDLDWQNDLLNFEKTRERYLIYK